MDIFSKKVKRFEINTIEELEKFIIDNSVKKHFRHFPDNVVDKLKSDIKNTDRINIKELRVVFLKKYFTCGTQFNKQYWLDRGFTLDESNYQISNIQTKNANNFHKVRRNNPDKYIGMYNTQIEYWLQKGFSEAESVLKIKERQSVFSKEKLIEKFGEDIAIQKLETRNKKWLKSLKENNNWSEISYKKGNNGKSKIRTISQYIDYYGELIGKIKFAKRYWGIEIKTLIEFTDYEIHLQRDRTLLFYDKDYRETILIEQLYKCGECDIHNTNALFHLHHIDYDKQNDKRNNLIFLCHSCHSKTTNSSRTKWIKYYTEKNTQFYEKTI